MSHEPFYKGLSVESCGSPLDVAQVGIAPTLFTTRRTRTISATAKIDDADLVDGIGKYINLMVYTYYPCWSCWNYISLLVKLVLIN